MMTTGSFAVVAAYIACSVGKTARDLSSLDSVISTALSNEIALTWRRFSGQCRAPLPFVMFIP